MLVMQVVFLSFSLRWIEEEEENLNKKIELDKQSIQD